MGVLGKRDGPQSARNNEQHRQLLDATLALLAEGAPYAELTVQLITARAGVSRPTFYAHFDDRRELLLELMESALTPALDDLAKQGPTSGTALGPTRIRPTIALAMSIAREHAPLFQALIEASTYTTPCATGSALSQDASSTPPPPPSTPSRPPATP